MKVIKLNNDVINIGEWDYQITPIVNLTKYTKEESKAIILQGRDPAFVYDGDGNVVNEVLNPLPEGAIEVDEEVVTMADGGRCVAGDHTKLRVYPSISDQLDYIYHNGIEAWKTDMIKPIKDKYPK